MSTIAWDVGERKEWKRTETLQEWVPYLEAQHNINYECQMVRQAGEILVQFPDGNPATKYLRYLALEGLLVHARAITDFFRCHRSSGPRGSKRADDILAID